VLWLDADTLVLSADLQRVLSTELPFGHIAMVHDCCRPVYNSGLMWLQPNVTTFNAMQRMPMGKKQGDQDLINDAFAGKIVALEARFNTHGYKSMSCDDVVVAHFTGRRKPTFPDLKHLDSVRTGEKSKQAKVFNFQCAGLYKQYFCGLKDNWQHLSRELQLALAVSPPCQS